MISVIIPMYNVEKYVHVCLNSVLNQNYSDFEIICIDDASMDSTLDILDYFTQKDSRIKILKNDYNRGPGFSRNRGLGEAKGDYILFLDGDDWLSSSAFECLLTNTEKNNLDVLIFKSVVYYEEYSDFGIEGYYDVKFLNDFENKIFNHFDLEKSRLFSIPNAPWNKFYKKSFLDENNIYFPNENLIHEDNPFYCSIITSANRISFINKYLYNRRRRPDSIMTLDNERLFDNIDIVYLILEVFLKNSQLYLYYKHEVLRCIFDVILDTKYEQIEEQFKEEFYNQVQEVYKNFITDYGLYNDILENVEKSILDKFQFDEIVENINHNPKISVIIPVYNVEKYLKECLDSVVNQSFRDIEIICVDDGSTDNSLNILKSYWRHDSRFTIASKENGGLASARNAGLKLAKGEFVYFIDSDDYLGPDALEEIYEISQKNNLDMLIFKLCSFDDETKEKFKDSYLEMEFLNELVGENIFNYKDLGSRMYDLAVTVPGVLFKKDLISDLCFPEGLIFEDNIFFMEAIFNAERVLFYNKYLYNYRSRKGSISKSGSKNFSDIIEIRNRIIDLANENDNFDGILYYKKLVLIKYRFLQTAEEFREDFFNKIQKDFSEHKDEYGSSQDFNNLPDNTKSIFYAGLTANDYKEFENRVTGKDLKISVIIPVYNVENYLSECLDSVLNQTFEDLEVICVNDGSTDSSPEILNDYAKKDSRIKIINQENQGLGAARNTGLKYANGKYVWFIDSDDFIEKDCLNALYHNAQSNDSDLVLFNFNFYDEFKNSFADSGVHLEKIFGNIDFDNFTFVYDEIKIHVMNSYFSAWSKLFKKEFLDKYHFSFQEGISYEDILFQIKTFLYSSKMSFLPKNLYNYRITNLSSIMNDKSKSFEIIPVIDSVEDFLKNSRFFEEFKLEFLIFKITQLTYHISLCENEEFFQLSKKELLFIQDKIDDLPDDFKNKFNRVINASNLMEYDNP